MGFPYSQDLRDSGNYYDCSYLAYYSWKDAGVDVRYGGATTEMCIRDRSKDKYIPVMSDFYDILMAQPEDEAKDIAWSLELFVNGSLNIFNHQTNVDVDNRFTVYMFYNL